MSLRFEYHALYKKKDFENHFFLPILARGLSLIWDSRPFLKYLVFVLAHGHYFNYQKIQRYYNRNTLNRIAKQRNQKIAIAYLEIIRNKVVFPRPLRPTKPYLRPNDNVRSAFCRSTLSCEKFNEDY